MQIVTQEHGCDKHLSQLQCSHSSHLMLSIYLVWFSKRLLRICSVPGTRLEMNKIQTLSFKELTVVEETDALKINAKSCENAPNGMHKPRSRTKEKEAALSRSSAKLRGGCTRQPLHSQGCKFINNGNMGSHAWVQILNPLGKILGTILPASSSAFLFLPGSIWIQGMQSILTYCSEFSPATGLSRKLAGHHPVAHTTECLKTNILHMYTKELIQLSY